MEAFRLEITQLEEQKVGEVTQPSTHWSQVGGRCYNRNRPQSLSLDLAPRFLATTDISHQIHCNLLFTLTSFLKVFWGNLGLLF